MISCQHTKLHRELFRLSPVVVIVEGWQLIPRAFSFSTQTILGALRNASVLTYNGTCASGINHGELGFDKKKPSFALFNTEETFVIWKHATWASTLLLIFLLKFRSRIVSTLFQLKLKLLQASKLKSRFWNNPYLRRQNSSRLLRSQAWSWSRSGSVYFPTEFHLACVYFHSQLQDTVQNPTFVSHVRRILGAS